MSGNATEPGHQNGEFVNDVRVSPIDEGVERTNCHVRHDEPADLLRGHSEQHEVGVVVVKTAEPRENDSACVPNFLVPGDNDLQKNPIPRQYL